MPNFLVKAIYLLDKRMQWNMKFVPFSAAPKKLTSFWGADLERSIQFWLKHCKALQCHWIKLFPKFLVKAIYLSDKRKPIKYEILAFSAARNKLTSFWGADLERSIQFWLKHSKSLQCHWIKLFPNFLVQAIYLLDKRKQ